MFNQRAISISEVRFLARQALILALCFFFSHVASAAIALDRTRIILNGDDKTVSLSIANENKELPYLAQGWIENANGAKIDSPLVVLPPVQRVEPTSKSQLKIQALPAVATLPQDRESVFYFNLREIPPKSKKSNVLQIALQTKIKLFYRPASLYVTKTDLTHPWQEQILLERGHQQIRVINPTPYYVTIVNASKSENGATIPGFKSFMIAPKESATLRDPANALGATPVLTYINDYGGRPKLQFRCQGNRCAVDKALAS